MNKKIPGDKLLLVLSVALFAIGLIVSFGTYEKMKIKERNEKVLAKVIEAPSSCSEINSNWDGYCKLEFENKVHILRAGKNFCGLVVNKNFVEMLVNKERNKLIFIEEFDSDQFGNGFFILAVSIISMYLSISSIRLKS